MKNDVAVEDKRRDPKAWAKALQRRHGRGEKLLKVQIDFYREALGIEPNEDHQEA